MKKLSQILAESSDSFYHASNDKKINTKIKHPIWLSHNEHQARGWHKLVPESTSFKVELKPGTKIAHYADQKVEEHLKKHGVDIDDYAADLTANPESHEVYNHPGTKALKAAGYHGFTHQDYDPHDNQKDHETTVLFDRSRIKSQKKIF
jgi:hypothetical protein